MLLGCWANVCVAKRSVMAARTAFKVCLPAPSIVFCNAMVVKRLVTAIAEC